MDNFYRFIIVMGVSGSGKTTIGRLLAQSLNWDFYDADSFHPASNIAKMSNGIPLTDIDRQPWLDDLRRLIIRCIGENRPGVLACSALKTAYRNHLIQKNRDILVIFLKGDYELISKRMNSRADHYMKPGMLASQFETLEEPAGALVVDIGQPPAKIIETIIALIGETAVRSGNLNQGLK